MKLKNTTLMEWITYLGIISTLVVMLSYATGCAHTPVPDSRQCCQRLSLQQKQMAQFNRYCKVALFLSKSQSRAVGKGVKESAVQAVNICKFVFGVDTDSELVAAGDEQEYQRVRTYIVLPENEMGWRKTLDCDPEQPSCEEF